MRRRDVEAALNLSQKHVGRCLAELAGEGLVVLEREAGASWWSVSHSCDTEARMTADQKLGTTAITKEPSR